MGFRCCRDTCPLTRLDACYTHEIRTGMGLRWLTRPPRSAQGCLRQTVHTMQYTHIYIYCIYCVCRSVNIINYSVYLLSKIAKSRALQPCSVGRNHVRERPSPGFGFCPKDGMAIKGARHSTPVADCKNIQRKRLSQGLLWKTRRGDSA